MSLVDHQTSVRNVMKTHTKIAIIAGVAAIGAASIAGAVNARGGFGHHGGPWGGGRAMMMMEQFDADGDGKLTQAEIDGVVRSRLAAADSDGDGQLNLDEFQPLLVEIMRPRIVDSFQFLDDDGDAAITLEEIERPLGRMVGHLDRNDDGEITEDEMQRRHGGWKRGHHDDDDER
jgi:Ca2+-binding EF-hand superfamily protein